ncbi:MAG: hypothetical protein KBE04_12610 [Phycisphaerae bacterium]|nr:hypothetical protein [Phycisphaerae bacterium]
MTNAALTSMLITLCLVSPLLAEDLPVNIHKIADQKDPDLSVLPGGLGIAVWNSYDQDGDSGGIFARRIEPNGPAGPEFQVNALAAGNQAEPCAAVDANGFVLVAWRGPWLDPNDEDIVARLLDPNGQPLTEDFRVNTHAASDQSYPRAAAGPGGTFVVVWVSATGPDTDRSCIFGQRVDRAGNLLGTEMAISDTPLYYTRYPDVAIDGLGHVAASWLEDRTTDSVRVRLFDANCAPKGDSVKVNSVGLRGLARPSVAVRPDGALVVAWDGDPNKASDDDIRARVLDVNAAPLGDEFIVNTTRAGAQVNPRVAINGKGEFMVVWEGPTADPNEGAELYGQWFDANSQPVGGEVRLNEFVPGDQGQAHVAIGDAGWSIVVWESEEQDGSGDGIFAAVTPSTDPNALPPEI